MCVCVCVCVCVREGGEGGMQLLYRDEVNVHVYTCNCMSS